MKTLFKFLYEWSDILIFTPIFTALFIFGGSWISSLDSTALLLDVGTLSILNFNLLTLGLTFGCAYFIYAVYFGDWFKGFWENRVTTFQAAIINLILWLSTVGLVAFILLRNL